VKLCYCDESGTGLEPIATMVGIIVDASRMYPTKQDWQDLLDRLSASVGHKISEVHAKDLYNGNGVFHGVPGPERAGIITEIFEWLADRKHEVVYASVEKASFFAARNTDDVPPELDTVWRFLGFHIALATQKHFQRLKGHKGHTIFVFDNQERERMRYTDLIVSPPKWSDEYYNRTKRQDQLDQVVDVPYFGDSKDVVLIQLADITAFLLRRYAEVRLGLSHPKYDEEPNKLGAWMDSFSSRAIGTRIYRRQGRCKAEDYFYKLAPKPVRDL
jgi:hypothetical protein